jgi:hypothetical protein
MSIEPFEGMRICRECEHYRGISIGASNCLVGKLLATDPVTGKEYREQARDKNPDGKCPDWTKEKPREEASSPTVSAATLMAHKKAPWWKRFDAELIGPLASIVLLIAIAVTLALVLLEGASK